MRCVREDPPKALFRIEYPGKYSLTYFQFVNEELPMKSIGFGGAGTSESIFLNAVTSLMKGCAPVFSQIAIQRTNQQAMKIILIPLDIPDFICMMLFYYQAMLIVRLEDAGYLI